MSQAAAEACHDWADRLHSFADGELDSLHSREVERHLETCAACRAALAQIQTVRQRLGGAGLRWALPDAGRAAVMAALAQEQGTAKLRHPAEVSLLDRGWDYLRRWGAVPSFVALAAVVMLTFNPLRGDDLQDEILSSHIRSMLASHLVDVETSDRHTVRPWFNGKIDFSPPVVDLVAQGFPLVGGRVDYFGGRVVAALVYRRNNHVLNLFISPNSERFAHPVASTLDGYNFAKWSAGGLTFWAVSDATASEVSDFHALFSANTGY